MPLMLQRSQMEGLESMVGFSARFIAAQAIPSTIEGISAYFRSLEEEETKRQAIAANRDVLVSRINAERDVILVLQRRSVLGQKSLRGRHSHKAVKRVGRS